MPKPATKSGERKGDTVYLFIRKLIQEGEYAWFVNEYGRFLIKWDEAVKLYIEDKGKRNPKFKRNWNQRKASNTLRAALLHHYKKDGAKEFAESRRLGGSNKVIERQFQMPPRVFHSLFGTNTELPDNREHASVDQSDTSGISGSDPELTQADQSLVQWLHETLKYDVDMTPKESPMQGGSPFRVSFCPSLDAQVTSVHAKFVKSGIDLGNVNMVILPDCLLGRRIPGASSSGWADVIFQAHDGIHLGSTKIFYYPNEREVVVMIKAPSVFENVCKEMSYHAGNSSNTCSDEEIQSSVAIGNAQQVQFLLFLVYTAAREGAQQFIEMIFSTSAGRLVFNTYKNSQILPEVVAKDNGHNKTACYLEGVTKRFSQDISTVEEYPKKINWSELAKAAEEAQRKHELDAEKDSCHLESSLSTDVAYLGDVESSSSEAYSSGSEEGTPTVHTKELNVEDSCHLESSLSTDVAYVGDVETSSGEPYSSGSKEDFPTVRTEGRGEVFKKGQIDHKEPLGLAAEIMSIWEQIGLASGVINASLDEIHGDYHKALANLYTILRKWKESLGSGASSQKLDEELELEVFKKLDLIERSVAEVAREGIAKHAVELKDDENLHEGRGEVFKRGQLYDKELLSLSAEIMQNWKQIFRALAPTNASLVEVHEVNLKALDKLYATLRKWKESLGFGAIYQKLDEELEREVLTERYCQDKETSITRRVLPSVEILPGKPFHVTRRRGREIRKVNECFVELRRDVPTSTVIGLYITGPPGCGKTQLVRQVGEEFMQNISMRGHYETVPCVVATLQAQTPEAMLESYKKLHEKLEIPNAHECQGSVRERIKSYMEDVKNYLRRASSVWLLIVDNLTINDPMREFWPSPGQESPWGEGTVLVTTQDSELVPRSHENAEVLPLDSGMEEEDAMELLRVISGIDLDEDAKKVADVLGYFPLSLACAAVYVGQMREDRPLSKFSWKNYLSNLQTYYAYLDHSDFTDHNPCYPRSMLPAAEFAARRMAENNEVLRAAFLFLSYCSLQPVPLDTVANYVLRETKARVPDDVKLKLARCSLLIYPQTGERGIEVVTLHQVMRMAFSQIRRSQDESERNVDKCEATSESLKKKELNGVLQALNEAYMQKKGQFKKEDLAIRILLCPHLKEFVEGVEVVQWLEETLLVKALVHLADGLVHVAGATNNYRVALLERAYKINKQLGCTDIDACTLLCDLGSTYREAGLFDKVIPILDEAKKLCETQMRNRRKVRLGRDVHSWPGGELHG